MPRVGDWYRYFCYSFSVSLNLSTAFRVLLSTILLRLDNLVYGLAFWPNHESFIFTASTFFFRHMFKDFYTLGRHHKFVLLFLHVLFTCSWSSLQSFENLKFKSKDDINFNSSYLLAHQLTYLETRMENILEGIYYTSMMYRLLC